VSGSTSFGDFTLDHDTRELRRGVTPIKLSPKALYLLEILVRNRPKALSKAVLLESLWPDSFVVEKNLVNLVAEIREALGDDPAGPRFVRTVHRFGYAFTQPAADPESTQPVRNPVARLVWSDGRAGLADGEHVIGRDPDLVLFLDAPNVSRRHAVIRIGGGSATLEDLGSKNGTFVGGVRVTAPVRLADGDLVGFGSLVLTFHTRQPLMSTETQTSTKARERV
jgi:DNA-binding winged helix-turn-helix (wHTH) protein